MSASQNVFVACILSIIGIGIASLLDISQTLVLTVFIFGTIVLTIFLMQRKKMIISAGIFFIAFGFGIWIEEHAEESVLRNPLQAWYGQEVIFEAKVVQAPQQKPNSWQITVEPTEISYGHVLLTVVSQQGLRYGDRVEVQGRLEEPPLLEDFDYAAFLAKEGVYATMFRPDIRVLEQSAYEGPGEYAVGIIQSIKRSFEEALYSHVAPPGSEIAAAMLLGNKGSLSAHLAANLNKTGLRHITAISGMHVAILTAMLMSLLLWLGFWRQQAFYGTILLITLFIVLTGLQSSAVRAGIMGGMVLLAQHLGRRNVSSRALVFAATGMLFLNPFLLIRDLGFQLSFLAVFGIIHFLPIFQDITRTVPRRFSFLRDVVGMTISAQIFTLPILIANFGMISLVTVVTNLLIVPVLPWLMGFGFLFLLLGILAEPLALILSVPVSLLLMYITAVIDIFASVPFAVITQEFSLLWLLLLYIPVGYVYWKFRRRHEGFLYF